VKIGIEPMRQQPQTPKRKQKSPDDLLKTSKKKDIELTEKELGDVTGGATLREPIVWKWNPTTKV
jgi:hypothetical protein